MSCQNVDDNFRLMTAAGIDTGYANAYLESTSVAVMIIS